MGTWYQRVLPLVSVWGYQLDGILLAQCGRVLGNDGLWCAFCSFMVLRGVLLGVRLPRIGHDLTAGAPVF